MDNKLSAHQQHQSSAEKSDSGVQRNKLRGGCTSIVP